MNIDRCIRRTIAWSCLLGLVHSAVDVVSGVEATAAEGIPSFGSGLNLPQRGVSRRLSRYFPGPKPETVIELEGPGCIRRIWVTGGYGGDFGRNVVLRIYFDGHEVPHVEAPLADFFGVMHNLKSYPINTPFLAVKPKNGYTCYFLMPFAKSARFEFVGNERTGELYYMIDWHEYPGQDLKEPMRFCARWRREAPCQAFGEDFFMIDADGPGRLIGFVLGLDMLESRHTARWSHAGADNIYIDGDGEHPAFLRGIGGEDAFGTSYSGGDYVAQTSLFSDMPYYVQKDEEGHEQRLVGYRFFVSDAIYFTKSLHMRFSSRAHDMASTVYWYSSQPVRPYFEMPPIEKRLPGSKILRGEYDLPLPESGEWWLAGPFPLEFDKPFPRGAAFNPNHSYHGRRWIRRRATHGFIEFNHVFTPPPSNSMEMLTATAVARCTIDAPADMMAKFRIGWDDQLVLQVNEREPLDLGRQAYLRAKTIEVPLRKGENAVALRLSNTVGLTRSAWNFVLCIITPDGKVLLPRAEEKD